MITFLPPILDRVDSGRFQVLFKKLAAGALAVGVCVLGIAPAHAMSGGEKAAASDAPWMVALAGKGDVPLPQRAQCGAVLIAPDRVATAAHCLDGVNALDLEAHLGSGSLSGGPGRV